MTTERGSVSVELVLLTPLLMVLVLFGVYAGRASEALIQVRHAADQAARAASKEADHKSKRQRHALLSVHYKIVEHHAQNYLLKRRSFNKVKTPRCLCWLNAQSKIMTCRCWSPTRES